VICAANFARRSEVLSYPISGDNLGKEEAESPQQLWGEARILKRLRADQARHSVGSLVDKLSKAVI
jgi:hypothetical protein